jgi:hypothetical protein
MKERRKDGNTNSPRTSHQFQTLDLPEMSRIAEHVDVEEFGDIVVAGEGVYGKEGGVSEDSERCRDAMRVRNVEEGNGHRAGASTLPLDSTPR